MGDKQNRDFGFLIDSAISLRGAGDFIHSAEGFVHEKNIREAATMREAYHSLLLTAGKLIGISFPHRIPPSRQYASFLHRFLGLLFVRFA